MLRYTVFFSVPLVKKAKIAQAISILQSCYRRFSASQVDSFLVHLYPVVAILVFGYQMLALPIYHNKCKAFDHIRIAFVANRLSFAVWPVNYKQIAITCAFEDGLNFVCMRTFYAQSHV